MYTEETLSKGMGIAPTFFGMMDDADDEGAGWGGDEAPSGAPTGDTADEEEDDSVDIDDAWDDESDL
ncbi:MAG: hypothetical protein COV07_04495 [Candidatus Vogelbacteria bacterium CG10_big_fil_rev_8_21_14_0_10_45_14]|uniref:Uncharacterized protein n=1 Tax=Candidatus Vogelbacteria bacterium CG10_big_fil_rev_8_21_14_0_10_45_14 TaxID=1975042 RepID=A0A2H0RKF3_9BACT|nr:MAG: hypothetical protein COV07_04495 [Candidatus Vogelbacteria bacterium CG10_big_fil_rev_8_21_14_0_10_45_14]